MALRSTAFLALAVTSTSKALQIGNAAVQADGYTFFLQGNANVLAATSGKEVGLKWDGLDGWMDEAGLKQHFTMQEIREMIVHGALEIRTDSDNPELTLYKQRANAVGKKEEHTWKDLKNEVSKKEETEDEKGHAKVVTKAVVAEHEQTHKALWSQFGYDYSKCENGANSIADQFACQQVAASHGHQFYQYATDNSGTNWCKSVASCDSPQGTEVLYRIFQQADDGYSGLAEGEEDKQDETVEKAVKQHEPWSLEPAASMPQAAEQHAPKSWEAPPAEQHAPKSLETPPDAAMRRQSLSDAASVETPAAMSQDEQEKRVVSSEDLQQLEDNHAVLEKEHQELVEENVKLQEATAVAAAAAKERLNEQNEEFLMENTELREANQKLKRELADTELKAAE